jgi:uracil phosphoribosyltransferase
MNDPDILSDHLSPKITHIEQQIKKSINNHQQQPLVVLFTQNSTISDESTKMPNTAISNDSHTSASYSYDLSKYNNGVKVLECNNQIKELHTVLRDKETSHSDFKFYADRLIRLLVEEGLNELPYSKCNVITPTGCEYKGVKYIKGVCGVSIMRSGEAMEKGLRECCRSIRIGKILIQAADEDKKKSSVIYSKFPEDIISRKVLLMYPITTSGSTINLAINVLKEHGVVEDSIVLLCLFATPSGLQSVNSQFPNVHILVSEIHPIVPNDFGQRYFGTE